MRYIRLHEQVKVPVMKNVIYAFKLIWNADKKLFLGYVLAQGASRFFSLFIQNILFLKVLLTVIDGERDFAVYVKYLLLFALVSLVLKALSWYGEYTHQFATKRVLKNLNNKIFEKAVQLDISCYEDPEFYDKYQRATLVLQAGYFDVLCYNIASMLGSIISFVCVVTTVTAIDPMYLLFLVPVLFVFAVELSKSKCVYKRDLEMTTNNRVKAYVQRTVFLKDFSKDIRTSNIFAVLMQRFERAINSNIKILKQYGVKLFVYSMVSSALSEFIPIIGTYALAGYQFIYKDTMTISGFSVVLSSINSVRSATLDIAEGFDELSQMALYFQNLKDFFNYQPKVVSGTVKAPEFESLELKNVSFRYPGAEKNSINDVSFKINKGETCAVVGINGAGKSTLVKLILRFYDVTEGQILYNGIDIREYDIDSLRIRFGTVFQDYKNFAVSVFENVMCRRCSEDDKKIAETALKQSGVWDKINSFAKGGDTVLTREFDENGAGLSGGENQKVSTARLFASDFDVAILDEPSSALDPVAEYKMYENLISLTKNKTVLYISHRLSSAVLSDKIFVISSGRLIETGSHSQLMSLDGEYAKMFKLQSKSYREEGQYEA